MNTEEWNKALEQIQKVWEQFTSTIEEAADRIVEIFHALQEEEQKKSIMTPRKYGMSVLNRHKFDTGKQSCKTNYMPTAPKNRPYQRRNF